jgi:FtsP/CotA-like multicopper oxidase with cupredoxin domain
MGIAAVIYFLSRRTLLQTSVAGAATLLLDPPSLAASNDHEQEVAKAPADLTLRIGPVLVDVAEDRTISTIGYNGNSPGPLIRLKEGKSIAVEIINDTDTPEFVHWHG